MKNYSIDSIDRRNAIFRIGGMAAFGLGILGPSEHALAQQPCNISKELLLSLGYKIQAINRMTNNQILSENPDDRVVYVEMIKGMTQVLSEIKLNADEMYLVWRHEYIELSIEIQNMGISTTKGFEKVAPDPKSIKVEKRESCWGVLLSIILETIGIDDALKRIFDEVLKRAGLETLGKEIMKASIEKNWPKVSLQLEDLISRVFQKYLLEELKRNIPPAAYKKMLGKVAGRFVPWIGWGLFCLSLLTSISHNWDELRNCEF